jgi:response regulator NasT
MPAESAKPLSILIVTDPAAESSSQAHAIAQALADAGSLVLGVRAGDATLAEAIEQLQPDVVVVRSDSGVRDVLEHIAVATQHARRPIALFTDSDDRPTMREALTAGVSAYVVKGAARERVQAVIDVAVERFAAESALRAQLDAALGELEDRKAIDRAKRLLMSRKQLGEPEAHRFLQDLAMRHSIRLRAAAERVLDLEELLR